MKQKAIVEERIWPWGPPSAGLAVKMHWSAFLGLHAVSGRPSYYAEMNGIVLLCTPCALEMLFVRPSSEYLYSV